MLNEVCISEYISNLIYSEISNYDKYKNIKIDDKDSDKLIVFRVTPNVYGYLEQLKEKRGLTYSEVVKKILYSHLKI